VTKEGRIDNDLASIKSLAYTAYTLFQSKNADTALVELGSMLSETWKVKKSLSSSISNDALDQIYQTGMKLGAYGGKLAGAGGGGFFIFLVPPDVIPKMQDTFGENAVVKVAFQDEGSRLAVTP
jgi:D-glycero-alpha-D-manno-heptose-7-phosphate kinase